MKQMNRKQAARKVNELASELAGARISLARARRDAATVRCAGREPPVGFYRGLGLAIRAKRLSRNLTQEEVAFACSISRASLSNIEAGRQQCYVHHLHMIADTLEASVSALLHSARQVGKPGPPMEQY